MCQDLGFCSSPSRSVLDSAAVVTNTGLHPPAECSQISLSCSSKMKLNTANSRSGSQSFWKLKWSFPGAQFWFPEHTSNVCSPKRWPTQAGLVPTGFEGFFYASHGEAWLKKPDKSLPWLNGSFAYARTEEAKSTNARWSCCCSLQGNSILF